MGRIFYRHGQPEVAGLGISGTGVTTRSVSDTTSNLTGNIITAHAAICSAEAMN
jgi:hypothetical protein